MKRVIACLLAFCMIISLCACGKKKRQIIKLTLSTEDSEAILAAAGITLPDVADVAAAGTTITYYSWEDRFHNYSEDEIINTGYFTFTEKYGCEVEWIECSYGDRFDGLANLVLSSNAPDFYPGYAESFPNYYLKGVFQSVDDYVDYTDPLWSGVKDYADTFFSLGDKHYMIVTDTTFNNVVAYNRRVMDEWGFDDPATLYYNDEWTWEVFYNMCLDFSDPDEDRYALDGYGTDQAFLCSSGVMPVSLDADSSKFVSNIDDPRFERATTYLYNLSKNQCSFPMWSRNGVRNGRDGGGIKEGLCLFWLRGSWAFTGPVAEISQVWGDITQNELMFAPLPRDENGDGNYYIDCVPSGYSLVSGAPNPEGVALMAACERFKIIDPTVISIDRKQLKEIYLWTDEMLEMWDACYALANSGHVVIDYEGGLGDKLSNSLGPLKSFATNNNPSTYAQIKEKHSERVNTYIEDLNAQIADFIS